ncbi:MAG TPA: Lpg1974 family pore-forming outer membrane protein [Thermoguttaceae bacterium]|nr:Lpg1974 family pore-forming outer membrane protein [Thermoguttaceae bacterium]
MRPTLFVLVAILVLPAVHSTVHAQEIFADYFADGAPPQFAPFESVREQLQEATLVSWDESVCEKGCSDGGCGLRIGVFGEFLYMRPRNAEIVFAVPFDGPIAPPPAVPIQTGRAGVVDPDYEPAFRVGLDFAWHNCSRLGLTYTRFESTSANQISADAGQVIRSMVSHPSTLDAIGDGLDAGARHAMDFHLADLDYRKTFACGRHYSMNYLVGIRYAGLNQDFTAQYSVIGLETVQTNVQFDGGGIRLGLEGETRSPNTGCLLYGRGIASFVCGEFRATYAQGEDYDASVVDTGWSGGRIVSIVELEIGIGWISPRERWRFTGGYLVSAWYNTVTTGGFIRSVQGNNFLGLDDTLTFDGLSARAELRF